MPGAPGQELGLELGPWQHSLPLELPQLVLCGVQLLVHLTQGAAQRSSGTKVALCRHQPVPARNRAYVKHLPTRVKHLHGN